MKYTIATDGSWEDSTQTAYSAAVLRCEDTGVETIHKAYTNNADLITGRNVGGECLAVILAIYSLGIAIKENGDTELPEVTILHDYNGVGYWANGRWATNKPSSRLYVKLLKNILKYVPMKSLEFEWVRGHGVDRLNNMADHYCSVDRAGAESADEFIKQVLEG